MSPLAARDKGKRERERDDDDYSVSSAHTGQLRAKGGRSLRSSLGTEVSATLAAT